MVLEVQDLEDVQQIVLHCQLRGVDMLLHRREVVQDVVVVREDLMKEKLQRVRQDRRQKLQHHRENLLVVCLIALLVVQVNRYTLVEPEQNNLKVCHVKIQVLKFHVVNHREGEALELSQEYSVQEKKNVQHLRGCFHLPKCQLGLQRLNIFLLFLVK